MANYFQSPGAGGSAHYVVDPGEVVRCLTETTVAYHAPPNTGSIGVELCDPQKGPASRWGDADHEAMLRLAAKLVRDIAARHDVPLRRLTVAEVRAGARGICGHVDVSKAFGQSDHTDPGDGFPWAHFMNLVNGEDDDVSAKDMWQFELPVPYGSKENPEWQAGNILVNHGNWLRKISGQLDAQAATIRTLAEALAQQNTQIDAQALMAQIEAAIEQVTIRLDVPDQATS